MPASRPIVPGEEYTANDINNLRSDVLSGHNHDGADGAKVPFSNLNVVGWYGSTPPDGGTKSYNDIANHVSSSQGQHGLHSTAHALGTNTAGLIIQGGYSPGSGSQQISFPLQFTQDGSATNPVSVIVTVRSNHPQGDPFSNNIGATVTTVSSTAFVVDVDGDHVAGIYWMAMGLKT
jgi:hypothetical protein